MRWCNWISDCYYSVLICYGGNCQRESVYPCVTLFILKPENKLTSLSRSIILLQTLLPYRQEIEDWGISIPINWPSQNKKRARFGWPKDAAVALLLLPGMMGRIRSDNDKSRRPCYMFDKARRLPRISYFGLVTLVTSEAGRDIGSSRSRGVVNNPAWLDRPDSLLKKIIHLLIPHQPAVHYFLESGCQGNLAYTWLEKIRSLSQVP